MSFQLKLARKFPVLRKALMRSIYRKKGITLNDLISFENGKFFLYGLDETYIPAEGLRDDISITLLRERTYKESLHSHKPSPGDTLVDLGAGLGEEILEYSRLVGDSGQVIAVEAHPAAFAVLSGMIKKNGLKNVIACQYALGPTKGKMKIGTPGNSYESAFVGTEGLDVDSITLPELIRKFNLPSIHFLKSNTEGAERYLFEGENLTALLKIKNMAIACHDFRFKAENNDFFRTKELAIETLKKMGYDVRQRQTGIDYLDDWIYASNKFA